jgi:large subunit ribosomal protein L24
MKTKLHIKKGDVVVAIAGDDAAGKKTGKVLQLFPHKEMAIVEGLNYVKKCMKKSQDNPQGGIVEKEAAIAISNLKLASVAEKKTSKAKATDKGAKK